MRIAELTIKKLYQGLLKKEFSAKEIIQSYLKNIEITDKEVSAYLFLDREKAIEEAEAIDRVIREKKHIPILAGVPFGIKDNILVKDLPCTAGSKIRPDSIFLKLSHPLFLIYQSR